MYYNEWHLTELFNHVIDFTLKRVVDVFFIVSGDLELVTDYDLANGSHLQAPAKEDISVVHLI